MNKALNETFGYDGSVTLIVFNDKGGSWQNRIKVQEWKVRDNLSAFDCKRIAELFLAAAAIANGKEAQPNGDD